MIPAPHPSLDTGPAARPICSGCQASGEGPVLVPLCPKTPTTFVCLPCAGRAWRSAFAESVRRQTEAVLDFDPLAPAGWMS